jgi:hypothetical protein
MKTLKIFSAFIILQLTFLNVSAQQIEQVENWIIPGDISLQLEYRRYSREDAEILRNKYLLLREQSPVNEWEGEYSMEAGGVNLHSLIWLDNLGFAEYNIYTCLPALRYANYGKTELSSETVKLIPEFQKNSPRKTSSPTTLVKIKWGEIHYLVPESYISAFSESAAGLDIKNTDGTIAFPYYYTKIKDAKNEVSGLPTFPDSYKKFLLYPIETNILSLGNRYITSEKNEWNGEIEKTANYDFIIAAGQKQGVKVGMSFYISNINEWFQITKVNPETSVGGFVRQVDENEKEVCFNGEYEKIPCLNLSVGLKVKTMYQPFYY